MIKINLLPKEIQEKGKGVEWVYLGGFLVGIFVILGMSVYFAKLQSYKKDVAKKERWSRQLKDAQDKVAKITELDGQKAQLEAKKNTAVQLLQGRLFYPKLMETFYSTIPTDIWINSLTFTEDAQRNVKIVADSNSLTTDAIAKWYETLESKSERFSGITISVITAVTPTDPKESPAYKFTMTFTCTPPPAGA